MMDDSSLSIDNHSIRVIDTAQDDDETLTSRVSQMTSSITGNRRRYNNQGPLGNEFSMEEGPDLSDFYADYEFDVSDATDSESDPVFSVFESEDDTQDTMGDGGDTFQGVWKKKEDDNSFDELFAKWAAGDMSNDEFNTLMLTLKDEEDSYKGSFRKPTDAYVNNNDEYLIQSETLSANDENTTSSFGHDDMHHSQKHTTANYQFSHLGLDVSSQVDLRIDNERSMLSAALQPLQKDRDFQSIPVSRETSNTGNLGDVQMPVVTSATRDSFIADEKSRKSNVFPQQIRVPNFISKVFGQDGANTKIDQPGNNDLTMLEESFSIDEDVFVDNTKQVKASKMVENMKKMYATLFDEEDVFIENTRDIPDVNGKDGRSIDVNYGHDIKEIYIHVPVERIEMDEEARMVSENNRNSCDYPHSLDKRNWQTKVNKKLAAVFVLALLGACGTLIWWLMDMHFKAAPPSKPDFLEERI